MDRHNKNRETLCSWVFAFISYLNLLHQLVMLGPKQKQPQPRGSWAVVCKGSWANYGGAEINTAGRNSVIYVFSPILATKKTNLSYLNCLIFYDGVAELALKICYNCYFLQREIQRVKQYHT